MWARIRTIDITFMFSNNSSLYNSWQNIFHKHFTIFLMLNIVVFAKIVRGINNRGCQAKYVKDVSITFFTDWTSAWTADRWQMEDWVVRKNFPWHVAGVVDDLAICARIRTIKIHMGELFATVQLLAEYSPQAYCPLYSHFKIGLHFAKSVGRITKSLLAVQIHNQHHSFIGTGGMLVPSVISINILIDEMRTINHIMNYFQLYNSWHYIPQTPLTNP